MTSLLKAGTKAPEFTLPSSSGGKISLKEFSGKPVVLAFYPADFSPVCSDQLSLYNQILPEFQKLQAKVLGISVDGAFCHLAFSKKSNIHFPLLADFEPKGATAKKYGAYDELSGICKRALFVIDKNGTIAWSYLSPPAENPGADGILEALEKLAIE